MKILSLEIINNKAVRAFFKELNGDNLEIAGGTGEGKTTAISALWEIIEKCPDAVTHGEKSGQIKIKIGDGERWLIAERRNTAKSSTINIFDQDGNRVNISDFKAMVSSLAVNPHRILDMKPTEQAATLLKAAKVEIDLDAMDSDIARAEQDRLISYREAESRKPGPEPEKTWPVNFSELAEELQKRQAHNSQHAAFQADLRYSRDKVNELNREAERHERQLEEVKNKIAESKRMAIEWGNKAAECKKWIENNPMADENEIREKINKAQEVNDKAAAWKAWSESVEAHKKAEAWHRHCDRMVKDLRETKMAALENAKWPLAGLSIEDGNIYFNGVLLRNLGTSKQMLVCAALAVEDIAAHPLKVVRIYGVESMSKADYEKLRALFNGNDIQVLSTRVSRGDFEPNEIVITEGVHDDRS